MGTLTTGMMIVFLVAAGTTALAMLSVFANSIKHETQLHDLRNRVKELHYQHAMYLARISGQIPEEGEIEILDEEGEVEVLDDDGKIIEVGEVGEELPESDLESQPFAAQSLPEPAEPRAAAAA